MHTGWSLWAHMSYDAIGRACVICKKKNCAVPGNRTQHLQLTNKLPCHQSSRSDSTRMGTLFLFSCLLSIMLSNGADQIQSGNLSVTGLSGGRPSPADPPRRASPAATCCGPLRRAATSAAPAGCGCWQPSARCRYRWTAPAGSSGRMRWRAA